MHLLFSWNGGSQIPHLAAMPPCSEETTIDCSNTVDLLPENSRPAKLFHPQPQNNISSRSSKGRTSPSVAIPFLPIYRFSTSWIPILQSLVHAHSFSSYHFRDDHRTHPPNHESPRRNHPDSKGSTSTGAYTLRVYARSAQRSATQAKD